LPRHQPSGLEQRLLRPAHFARGDKERFLRSVTKGVRAMPAGEGIVRPDQIEAIWAYIGSVNGWDRP
jgi:mono/diheme cytochrome c family protein